MDRTLEKYGMPLSAANIHNGHTRRGEKGTK